MYKFSLKKCKSFPNLSSPKKKRLQPGQKGLHVGKQLNQFPKKD